MEGALKRPSGTHFYRYASAEHLERLKQVLLKHELYFPTVVQLNDPAEGKPRIAKASARVVTRFLMRMYRRAHPEASLDEMARQAGIAGTGVALHGLDWVQREMATLLHGELKGIRVFSMSRRWDNMSMWAKYAGDHTGYCLEFTNAGIFGAAHEVEYGDVISIDLDQPVDAALLFRKTSDWSNEEEIRLVGSRSWPAVVPLDPLLLSRVILGKDMRAENVGTVRSWARSREPKLLVVQTMYDPLELALKIAPI